MGGFCELARSERKRTTGKLRCAADTSRRRRARARAYNNCNHPNG
jgi:hypothetical protein